MWYVVQVRTGTEHNIRTQCSSSIADSILKQCFIPYYEEKRRIRGQWIVQQRLLFPGYVFMVTERIEELYIELKQIVGLTKLIGTGDEVIPLSEEETAFLLNFGGKDQVVEMSEGIIEGSQVKVLSGPLMGKEGLIRKIDRHKRKAYLEIEMFGRVQKVQVGLEITMKTV